MRIIPATYRHQLPILALALTCVGIISPLAIAGAPALSAPTQTGDDVRVGCYDNGIYYTPGNIIQGSDGRLYKCVQSLGGYYFSTTVLISGR